MMVHMVTTRDAVRQNVFTKMIIEGQVLMLTTLLPPDKTKVCMTSLPACIPILYSGNGAYNVLTAESCIDAFEFNLERSVLGTVLVALVPPLGGSETTWKKFPPTKTKA
jgi:hypothetical protein